MSPGYIVLVSQTPHLMLFLCFIALFHTVKLVTPQVVQVIIIILKMQCRAAGGAVVSSVGSQQEGRGVHPLSAA